jgi:mannose-6-phosphate isomerase-like protein (cupin superfamily)
VHLLELVAKVSSSTEGTATIYVVLDGEGRITRGGDGWTLAVGETWLVPACLGDHSIEPQEKLRLLRVRANAR